MALWLPEAYSRSPVQNKISMLLEYYSRVIIFNYDYLFTRSFNESLGTPSPSFLSFPTFHLSLLDLTCEDAQVIRFLQPVPVLVFCVFAFLGCL